MTTCSHLKTLLLPLYLPHASSMQSSTIGDPDLDHQLNSARLFSFPIGFTAGSSLAVCLLVLSCPGLPAGTPPTPGLGVVPVGGGGDPIDEGW